MIITVTLNAAVDKTYTIANFALDRVHRPTEYRIVPGGKGINVSRVLKTFGLESLALGFAGGHTGGFIVDGLKNEGIASDFAASSGESRVCITIIDPEYQTQTEVNENGPEISPAELSDLEERLINHLNQKPEALVLSGSIPPGVPGNIYARWIEIAKEKGVWTVLDSSGISMVEGLKALPDCIKPNNRELAQLAGQDIFTTEETIAYARGLVESGIQTVYVSMGRTGAVACSRDESWISIAPEIDFVSAVGSGDSFVAGFVFGRHHGYDLKDSLRISTAAGSANAMSFGAGFCSLETINQVNERVKIVNPAEAESII